MYRFQRAKTTAISFSRLSMAFESMVSSVPLTAGDGLAVRYLPWSAFNLGLFEDGGFGRND
jgi:hypothetical protein